MSMNWRIRLFACFVLITASVPVVIQAQTEGKTSGENKEQGETWSFGSDGSRASPTKGKVILKQDCGKNGSLVVRRIDSAGAGGATTRLVTYHIFLEAEDKQPLLRWESFFEDQHPIGSVENPDISIVGVGLTDDDAVVVITLHKNEDWYQARVLPPQVPENDKERGDLAHWSRHWRPYLRRAVAGKEALAFKLGGRLFDKSMEITVTNPKTNVAERWGLGYQADTGSFGWIALSNPATEPVQAIATQPAKG